MCISSSGPWRPSAPHHLLSGDGAHLFLNLAEPFSRFWGVSRGSRSPMHNVLCGWLPRCKDYFRRSDLVRYSLVSGLLLRFF
jgi:hypothetical protein